MRANLLLVLGPAICSYHVLFINVFAWEERCEDVSE